MRELGPYRNPPEATPAGSAVARHAALFGALAAGLIVLVVASAIWFPGTTFAVVGAVLLYVVAPWFITRAPGR